MLDRHEHASKQGAPSAASPEYAESSRAMQPYVNRDTSISVSIPAEGTDYAELFARLQKLIDNATQTIRDLRRENAELTERVSQLDAYIQTHADAVDNEAELQKSASQLEELLTLQSALVPPVANEPHPVLAPPTPLRVYDPAPPAPARAMSTPSELLREPAATAAMNGHAPAQERPIVSAPALPSRSTATPLSDTTSYIAPEQSAISEKAPIMPAFVPIPAPAPVVDRAEPSTEPSTAAPVAPSAMSTSSSPALMRAAPPTPLSSAIRRPTSTPMIGNDKAAGTYTLIVYPFMRFSDLGQFQSVLQEVVGIHDVQVRRFAQGTLEMRLGYDGSVSLAQALHNLSVGIEDVEEEEPYRLRVRLDLNHAP